MRDAPRRGALHAQDEQPSEHNRVALAIALVLALVTWVILTVAVALLL